MAGRKALPEGMSSKSEIIRDFFDAATAKAADKAGEAAEQAFSDFQTWHNLQKKTGYKTDDFSPADFSNGRNSWFNKSGLSNPNARTRKTTTKKASKEPSLQELAAVVKELGGFQAALDVASKAAPIFEKWESIDGFKAAVSAMETQFAEMQTLFGVATSKRKTG